MHPGSRPQTPRLKPASRTSKDQGERYTWISILILAALLSHMVTGLHPVALLASNIAKLALPLLYVLFRFGDLQRPGLRVPIALTALFVAFAWASLFWSREPQFARAVGLLLTAVNGLVLADYMRRTAHYSVVEIPVSLALLISTAMSFGQMGGLVRGAGSLEHATDLSTVIIISALLASRRVVAELNNSRPRIGVFALCGGIFLVDLNAALNIAGSRGALIGIGAAALWIYIELIWLSRRNFKATAGIIVAGIASYAVYVYAISTTFFYRVQSMVRYFNDESVIRERSLYIRDDMFHDAVKLWEQSPLIGHGLDSFRFLAGYGTYSHNNYSEILSSLGIIGFALFYGMLLYSGLVMRPNRIRAPKFEWDVGRRWAAVLLIVLLANGLHSVGYYDILTWILVALLLGQRAFDGGSDRLSRKPAKGRARRYAEPVDRLPGSRLPAYDLPDAVRPAPLSTGERAG